MPRLLVINPNTSAHVTEALSRNLAAQVPAGWQIQAVTARFGAAYIASEAAYAIAAHAVLDAWATAAGEFDAVLVGCFGDPGLDALREIAGVPVLGLAETAMQAAARHGRFAIVTGGERWPAILRRRVAATGLSGQLAGIRVLPESGAELLADPARAIERLTEESHLARDTWGVEAVIIGGAALAGMGDVIAARLSFCVIDNVSAAARALTALPPAQPALPQPATCSGLSTELICRLAGTARELV
ncbi:MAG: Asp/Glu racemase [Candidatus Dactylopiibacterium carminicum]|uniref:Asp/Glu racemase n=1 Tax=Candidatus Dactylopiibacterium carminicum TaxID=857335 RepID=A0A272ESQ9_9RHOO|nr:aspartate/glutamate racemase family protein [Candidatus Dactylopiibacterium carminicum]KAF7598844.1 Asp/Glu racemase [Candidatus Dactylopiibacterium carminicum]PAS92760.1 MAG: Asp/Glu racemase [Candidatus Dactylopiibacterium carminicum]PAS96210.1 MAG: Asp/Glu racemase [Candidatus Dactylopiibacterium carminicum]PAS98862.1 MAG: hypothetical protein BSR46_10975 [Candidatus Dactylopiibacterium carminicum]